jgi:hypothetical protein
MPTPSAVITGNLQTLTGSADVGSVVFTLVNYGNTVPRVVGTALLLQSSVTAQADGSGNFSVTLWGNDVITPANTYYEVDFRSDASTSVQVVPYSFSGAGGSLNSLTPLNPGGNQVILSSGIFTSTSAGLVPASGGGTTNFLRADGTFAAPGGASFTPFTPVSHQFLTGVNVSGVFSAAQPAASDLSNGTTGSGSVVLATSPTLVTPVLGAATGTTLALGSTPAASGTLRLPSNTSIAWRNNANSGDVLLTKNASDQFTLGNVTVPNVTDTLVGKATTDTFTGKTFDTAGSGNSLLINGTAVSSVTGSGSVVLAASPTITGTLTASTINCTRLFESVTSANVVPVTVTGTTSQTALQAVSTAAAEMNTVGRWITLKARGFNSSGATGGTITYTLKVGTTTLLTFGAFTLANNLPNNAWFFEIDIMTQTSGASGALEVQGNGQLNNVATSSSFNSATISGIDLTQALTFTLFSTATQTTTSTTSRLMGYQGNN